MMRDKKLTRVISRGTATFGPYDTQEEAERAAYRFIRSVPECIKERQYCEQYHDAGSNRQAYRVRLEWIRMLPVKAA